MKGKLTIGAARGGLICLVKGAKFNKHFVTRMRRGYPLDHRGVPVEYEARLMLLDPPDDIWGLKITSVREKVVFAEPHRLEKLP